MERQSSPPQGETVGDQTRPKAYTDLDKLTEIFSRAKVIHVIRDGRDVCVSKRYHNYRKGLYYPGDEKRMALNFANRYPLSRRIIFALRRRYGFFDESWFRAPDPSRSFFTRTTLEKFAWEWRVIVEYLLDFQRKHPKHLIQVKYENLLSDTSTEMARLFGFLNADTDESIIKEIIRETDFHKLRKSDDVSFFRKGQSGDWKNHFRLADAKQFNDLAGKLLIELEYEQEAIWVNRLGSGH